jgi:hypothetical protein
MNGELQVMQWADLLIHDGLANDPNHSVIFGKTQECDPWFDHKGYYMKRMKNPDAFVIQCVTDINVVPNSLLKKFTVKDITYDV